MNSYIYRDKSTGFLPSTHAKQAGSSRILVAIRLVSYRCTTYWIASASCTRRQSHVVRLSRLLERKRSGGRYPSAPNPKQRFQTVFPKKRRLLAGEGLLNWFGRVKRFTVTCSHSLWATAASASILSQLSHLPPSRLASRSGPVWSSQT